MRSVHTFTPELGLQDLDLHFQIELVVLLEDLFLLGEHLLDGSQHPAEVLRESGLGKIALLRRVLGDHVARAIEVGDEEAPGTRQAPGVLLKLPKNSARLSADAVQPRLELARMQALRRVLDAAHLAVRLFQGIDHVAALDAGLPGRGLECRVVGTRVEPVSEDTGPRDQRAVEQRHGDTVAGAEAGSRSAEARYRRADQLPGGRALGQRAALVQHLLAAAAFNRAPGQIKQDARQQQSQRVVDAAAHQRQEQRPGERERGDLEKPAARRDQPYRGQAALGGATTADPAGTARRLAPVLLQAPCTPSRAAIPAQNRWKTQRVEARNQRMDRRIASTVPPATIRPLTRTSAMLLAALNKPCGGGRKGSGRRYGAFRRRPCRDQVGRPLAPCPERSVAVRPESIGSGLIRACSSTTVRWSGWSAGSPCCSSRTPCSR